MAHDEEVYSNLELVSDQGKQVAFDDGLVFRSQCNVGDISHQEKQVAIQGGLIAGRQVEGIEVSHIYREDSHSLTDLQNLTELPTTENRRKKRQFFHLSNITRRRKWLLVGFGVTILLCVIVGVIVGVLKLKAKESSVPASKSGSQSVFSSMAAGSSNSPSQSTLAASSVASNTAAATAIPSLNRKIAAVSYTSKSVNNTRVYYQDDTGQIMEATTSSDNTSWTNQGLGFIARNESPMAAAVTKSGLDPIGISVFYSDTNNTLHNIIFDGSTSTWTEGTLSTRAYTTTSNISLSALYNPCATCSYTSILVFQDPSGVISVANQTDDSDWTLETITTKPMNTAFVLQNNTSPRNIRAYLQYYDADEQGIENSYWIPGSPGWSSTSGAHPSIPITSLSPIAVGVSDSVKGDYAAWQIYMTISSTGIKFSSSATTSDDNQASIMSNATSPGKVFKDVAVTAIGRAFAVVSDADGERIEDWQVGDDLVSWTSMDNVDIGDAWGG